MCLQMMLVDHSLEPRGPAIRADVKNGSLEYAQKGPWKCSV